MLGGLPKCWFSFWPFAKFFCWMSWSNCLDRGCNSLHFYPAFSPASGVVSAAAGKPASAPLRSVDLSTFDYVLSLWAINRPTLFSSLCQTADHSSPLNKFLERGQEVSHELVFQSAKLFYEVG